MSRDMLHHMEQPTSGMDLKLARVAARVRQYQIAAGMGVSVSRVAKIEREQWVSGMIAERYRAALLTCVTRAA